MKQLGADCMFLDISHKPDDFVRQHFPMIYAKLLDLGMDLTKEPIPVVPAAHYTCGGVVVDDYGRTDVAAYMPLAKSVTPACTALTVWRPTRCWNA